MPVWCIPDDCMARVDTALFELAANQPPVFIVAKRPDVSGLQSQRGTRAQRRRDLPTEEAAAAGGADLLARPRDLWHPVNDIDGVLPDPDNVAGAHSDLTQFVERDRGSCRD